VHLKNLGGPLDNKLLSSLQRDQFDLLAPHLINQSLEQGLVLIEAGDEVDYVYFPHYGMLSLLAVLKDGKAIETATVGREGVVGAMAGLGARPDRRCDGHLFQVSRLWLALRG
jgi:CRP-like cAMP-binding protein